MLKCAYCKFARPFQDRDAEFVIDGQSVCEDHVDTASSGRGFGQSLYRLNREGGEGQ